MCRAHRLKVLLSFGVVLTPCGYLTSQMRFSSDEMQLTPRHAPALTTMQRIHEHGLSAGQLNPLLVVTYNDHAASPSLGCQDDNLDIKQIMAASPDPRLKVPHLITAYYLLLTTHLPRRETDYGRIPRPKVESAPSNYCLLLTTDPRLKVPHLITAYYLVPTHG